MLPTKNGSTPVIVLIFATPYEIKHDMVIATVISSQEVADDAYAAIFVDVIDPS